jgi:mRNA-degrading endonuclease toxin of MazEF toxin-antitoxin module
MVDFMEKDFCGWHAKESHLNNTQKTHFFREREVWFCHLGTNIGHEQDGVGKDFLRPVLVLRKFSPFMLWAVPLTKTPRESQYYFHFSFRSGTESFAVLSQIRFIDANRLSYRAGEMKKSDFLALKQKLKALLP